MKYAMMLVLAATVSAANAAAPAKDEGSPAKKLYAKKCSTCHGDDGKGKLSMSKMFKVKLEDLDLTSSEAVKKSDADLIKIVAGGKDKMPAFKGKLKDEEIADAIAYIRTLPAAAAKPVAK